MNDLLRVFSPYNAVSIYDMSEIIGEADPLLKCEEIKTGANAILITLTKLANALGGIQSIEWSALQSVADLSQKSDAYATGEEEYSSRVFIPSEEDRNRVVQMIAFVREIAEFAQRYTFIILDFFSPASDAKTKGGIIRPDDMSFLHGVVRTLLIAPLPKSEISETPFFELADELCRTASQFECREDGKPDPMRTAKTVRVQVTVLLENFASGAVRAFQTKQYSIRDAAIDSNELKRRAIKIRLGVHLIESDRQYRICAIEIRKFLEGNEGTDATGIRRTWSNGVILDSLLEILDDIQKQDTEDYSSVSQAISMFLKQLRDLSNNKIYRQTINNLQYQFEKMIAMKKNLECIRADMDKLQKAIGGREADQICASLWLKYEFHKTPEDK